MQQSLPGLDESLLNDYFYVDRERIAAYHTQLLGSGTPIESKFIENYSRSEAATEQAGIPKVFGGGFASTEGDTHGTERRFDLGWIMVLQTIEELSRRGYIHAQALGVPVGTIIRMHGALSIVDLRIMRDLWTPMMNIRKRANLETEPAGEEIDSDTIAQIAKLIPHPLVVNFITSQNPEGEPVFFGEHSMSAWGVLSPQHIIGSADSFALMNGGFVPGEYSMIAVLEVGSTPDIPMIDPFASFTPSNTFEMMLGMQQHLRNMFGRPNYANGVTPLIIYRSLKRRDAASIE